MRFKKCVSLAIVAIFLLIPALSGAFNFEKAGPGSGRTGNEVTVTAETANPVTVEIVLMNNTTKTFVLKKGDKPIVFEMKAVILDGKTRPVIPGNHYKITD